MSFEIIRLDEFFSTVLAFVRFVKGVNATGMQKIVSQSFSFTIPEADTYTCN